MKVSVINIKELDEALIKRWSQLQGADPALASPYFCPSFTQAVASVRNDVFVAVMENGGRIKCFFPFQQGRFGFGRPVGGALSDFQGVIAEAGTQWTAEALIRGSGLSVWDFDHLLASQAPF